MIEKLTYLSLYFILFILVKQFSKYQILSKIIQISCHEQISFKVYCIFCSATRRLCNLLIQMGQAWRYDNTCIVASVLAASPTWHRIQHGEDDR